jgi:hypothetical protein
MARTGWRGWLNGLAQNITGRRAGSISDRRRRPPYRRLELERLEDRLAPATNISIIAGVAGAGSLDHFLDATHGTITTADDPGDIAATLSTGALAGVNSTTNISIAADSSITFNDLGGTLSLQTGLGQNAAFSTTVAAISFNNTANTLATAGASLTFNAGADLTVANLATNGGDVNLTVNGATGLLTVNQSVTSTGFGSPDGNINFNANEMTFNAAVNAGAGIVTLNPTDPTRTISIGGADIATQLGLDDTDLSNVTAAVVRIGSSSQTGAISIDGNITRQAGYNTIDLNATGAGGAIVENGGSIDVANLALQADSGIGSAGAIDVVGPINLAFQNVTSNNVQMSSAGALTITTVDTLDGTTGHTIGNFASGGTETLSASSPITFAVNDTSSGTITATTTETASETVTPLPPPDDDITVNSGVTVESTGGDIVFTSGDSIVAQSSSLVKSDTGAVNLQAGVGDNDNDATLELNGAVSSGGGVTLSSPGDICVSGISAPGQNVTITSTNGAILDCGDPTADPGDASIDITAANLALSASTGIGIVSGNGTGPIETQVSNLVAQTSTGGIFIENTGNLTIGFSSDPFQAVTVTGPSGDIVLTDAGSVTVTTSGENIQGPANVSVTANGATANIQTGGFQEAIQNVGSGTVTLSAGQDIILGTPSSYGDVNADQYGNGGTASVVLNAARDITIQGTAVSFLDAIGPTGDVTGTAGRDINLLNGDANVFTNGGGTISLTAGAAFTDDPGSNVSTTENSPGANITVSADTMNIQSAINASAAIVTLEPTTSGRAIDLGTNPSAGNLGLAQGDLNNVTAGILRIGSTSAGNLGVSAMITAPATWSTLSLITGGAILDNNNADPDITVTNLALQAATGIADGNTPAISTTLDLNVGTVAALNTTSGSIKLAENSGLAADLTVGSVDGVIGVQNQATTGTNLTEVRAVLGNLTVNSPITAVADGVLVESNRSGGGTLTNNSTISSTSSTGVLIGTDIVKLQPGSQVTATNRVSFFTQTFGQAVHLGSATDTVFELSQDELNTITAGVLQIGTRTGFTGFATGATTGDITVEGPVTLAPAQVPTLDLETAGGIIESSGTLAVGNLALRATSGMGDAGALLTSVSNLAFDNSTSGAVQSNNTGALTITNVDNLTTSANAGASTTLSANSPLTFAVNTTSSGTLTATTTETASESTTPLPPPDDDVTVNSGVTVESTGGDVIFTSGDSIITQSGSVLKSDTGTVTLNVGVGDNDNDAQLILDGTISTATGFNLTSSGDICLGTIDAPGQTVTVTSTNGAIFDCNDPPTGTNNITADTVNLNAATGIGSVPQPGDSNAADAPIEITASTLSFSNSTSGDVQIVNLAGDLSASGSNSAPGGAINLTVTSGNLTTTAATGTAISAPGNTVTLNASGAIVSGTPSGVTDVGAANLAVTGATVVGTSANPLKTAVDTLAASVGTGSLFMNGLHVSNTGTLAIGSVGSLNGVTAAGGDVTISTSGGLNVDQAIGADLGVTLTGNGTINLNAGISITGVIGSNAVVQGGAGADVFNVNFASNAPLTLLGFGGNDTFNVPSSVGVPISIDGGTGTNALNYNALNKPVGTVPGALRTFGLQTVSYTSVEGINLNNAAAVDAFYGPDTADRASALAGPTPGERFVQVLYLDALGRAGSKAEVDAWTPVFSRPNTSQAQAQSIIAAGIEGSAEGRDHEVKSWYVHYLGRTATGGEELGWTNLLVHGQTEEQVLSQILATSEFFNHAQTLGFGGSADSQYVQALYELLMHRAGGSAEVAGWVGDLPTQGRQGVALGFRGSAEFRTDQFEGYYNALLHRPDDSAGLSAWLSSGADVFAARLGFEASPEFFTNG